MKKTLSMVLFLILTLTLPVVRFARSQQAADVTGVWLATDVTYAPWTFDLKQNGAMLTGRVWQNGAVQQIGEITDGKVDGDAVSFNISGPLDGGSRGVVMFAGRRNGDTIAFTRSTEKTGGAGNGLYGTSESAPKQLTATRQPAGFVTTPPDSAARARAASPAAVTRGGGTAGSIPTPPAGSEHWEAAGVGFAPWTFDLKIEGNTVTGTIGQASSDPPTHMATTRTGPFEISDGKVNGKTIEFKSTNAGTIITFQGTINGDEIQFHRSVNVTGGFNGIFGGNGATEFVAHKGRVAVVAPATAPASAPATPASPAAVAPASPLTNEPSVALNGASLERWQARNVPNAPWVFEFTIVGTAMIGTVRQGGAPREPVTIAAGKTEGANLSFKVLSPDGERTITFRGRVNGDEISFTREIKVLKGGSRGGNDLYGGSAPLQFIANRVTSRSAVTPAGPATSTQQSAEAAFPGPELLARPTDSSVTVNVVAGTAIEAYFEYGVQAGSYKDKTSVATAAANQPLVAVMNGLKPNTLYYYRMVYRRPGDSDWTARDEHSFHTQRPPGETFTFTVVSDSHMNIVAGAQVNSQLYQIALGSIARDSPDFHLDLGDTFAMDSVTTQEQANNGYLAARSFFGLISRSVPIFIVLGNHEQEEGWHLRDTADLARTPPVMSVNARKNYYPNPNPSLGSLYTGNKNNSGFGAQAINGDHLLEDYYAFQWGDALFVAIDPYWYSTTKPYMGNIGGGEPGPGSGDRWDWTLGLEQYQWLKRTLETSKARYKFIFAHNLTGGIEDYGRGGANAVPIGEWGGHDVDGTWSFDKKRPGWGVPIHQLLIDNHVSAFIHGHDHQFALEKRDGVLYQEVPMPSDAGYSNGFGRYLPKDPYTIKVMPNSGYLRFRVSPSDVTVEYVRVYLPGGGPSGEVAYSYKIVPD